jgi:hypothetical protein
MTRIQCVFISHAQPASTMRHYDAVTVTHTYNGSVERTQTVSISWALKWYQRRQHMTEYQQSLSSGAKTTLVFSSGANTYKLQYMTHMYEPKGPYLRELAVPKQLLRVSGVH